jgi:ADP-glucose pyrophosphorylase
VLTQYKARSLDRHITAGWGFLSRSLNEYIDVLPPQQRIDEHWYKGTADSIYQNIYSIEKSQPAVRFDPGRGPYLQDELRGHDSFAHRIGLRLDDRLHSGPSRKGPTSASWRSTKTSW